MLVIYHNDADGFAGLLAVHMATGAVDAIEYNYDMDPPADDVIAGRDIVIVDFSFDRATIEHMHSVAKSLVLYDHHKTAYDALNDLPYCHIDMKHAGCIVAFKALMPDAPIPKFFKYIEDRDLFKNKLIGTHAFTLALRTLKKDLKVWLEYALDCTRVDHLIELGKPIYEYRTALVNQIISKSFKVDLLDYKNIPCVACPILASDVLAKLAKGNQFAMMYSYNGRMYTVQFRSAHDGIDVSKIAKLLGGGGHRHAAGCQVKSLEGLLKVGG